MIFLPQFMPFSPIFLIPSVIFFYYYYLVKIKTKKKINVPPGPPKLPLIGNLHQLGDLPHLSLESLANEYGPLMHLQLGSIPTLVISSADIARQVFRANDVALSGRPVLYAANKFSYGCTTVSFAPYGEYWREIKKIMVLELLSAKRIQAWQAERDEEVENLIQTIACNNNNNNNFNLSQMFLSMANNVVCRVAFGKKYDGGQKLNFHEMIQQTQELLGGFCLADFFPWLVWINKFNGLGARLERCFREMDSFYDKVIEDHLDPNRPSTNEHGHHDVVDVLLQVQKDPNQALALSNDQIKAVLTDMFIAGTDTTAASLEWILSELMKNPKVMKKAQDEVRAVVSKEKGKVDENDLPKLAYLKLVIKEGLRLHPPAPLLVPRETTKSCEIEGFKIPPKTRVFVNAKMIGRDPKYWDNPNEFQPERFMDSSVDYRGNNFELIPFGFGRRSCPGINFSVLLIELVLANLFYHFDWELPNGMKSESLDMEEAFGITMLKKVPLCLIATPVSTG